MRKLILIVGLCLAQITVAETLVAAVADQDYPPFYYHDREDDRWRGVSVEVCEHVAASLGYELEYRRYPFPRLLQLVSAGRADVACTLFNTAERAPGLTYTSVPHAFESLWVFARRGTDLAHAREPGFLEQVKLGAIRAYYYGERFDDDQRFDKLRVNNERQLIRILLGGRIDYALGNKPAIEYHARRMEVLDELVFVEPPVFKGPIYIAFSRQRDDAHELAADFTRAIAKFRKTDEYAALLRRHGFEPLPF